MTHEMTRDDKLRAHALSLAVETEIAGTHAPATRDDVHNTAVKFLAFLKVGDTDVTP